MTGKDMVNVETWFDIEVDRKREGLPLTEMPASTMPSDQETISMKTGESFSVIE